MFSKRIIKVALIIIVLWLAAACRSAASRPTAEYPADVATRWFELELKLIRDTPGFSPPVASRALGYAGVTLYQSVVAGMPEHNSLVGQLNELDKLPEPSRSRIYHWPAVANNALAALLRALFPTATAENLAAIDALEAELNTLYASEAGQDVFDNSAEYGKELAAAVFEYSKSDGGHEGYTRNFPDIYLPPSDATLWKPTPPNYQAALQPYWGRNRPFVLNASRDCLVPTPTAYSEEDGSPFYAEAMEVYDTVKALTPEQEAIALFWADDPGATFTPPGHSISIATIVLRQEAADLAVAAETYARVGIAVSDAFIGCWYGKYTYNLIRPITYIQNFIDPDWNTPNITDPVITPPFPEYPSGHSTQSGATATVLTALFGDNYAFTDDTHAPRLAARSFSSFNEAAQEAAISRLYGGIHYRPAIELGVEQGLCIGERVNGLAWRK